MTETEIKDLWMEMFSGECPKGFLAIVAEYRKRKGFVAPASFDSGDFAVCSMLWDVSRETVAQNAKIAALEKALAALMEGKKNG